jgi:hypothetical protein
MFVPPAAIWALHGYVSLPAPLQGTLEESGGEGGAVTLSQFATAERASFTGLLEHGRLDAGSTCLARARVLDAGDLSKPGDEIEGPLTIRGCSVLRTGGPTADERLVTAQIIKAGRGGDRSKPRAWPAPGATAVLSYRARDVVACSRQRAVAFGTQPCTMPLAPVPSYIDPLITGAMPDAIVACANGLFVLARALGPAPAPDPRVVLDIAANLLTADIVVVTSPHWYRSGGVLSRLGLNAFIISAPKEMDRVARLQRALGAQQDEEKLLPAAPGSSLHAAPSLGLLRRQPRVDLQQVKDAAVELFPSAIAEQQPLVDWQGPGVTLSYDIAIVSEPPDEGDPAVLQIRELLHEGAVGAAAHVSHPAFRDIRPGEERSGPRAQLRRIASAAMQAAALPRLEQGSLDATTDAMSHALQKQVTDAALFPGKVQVSVRASAIKARGTLLRAAEGREVLVPAYASEPQSARMAAYVAGLAAAGVRCSFTAWDAPQRSGLRLPGVAAAAPPL